MTGRDDTPDTDFDLQGTKMEFPDDELASCYILIGPVRLIATVCVNGQVKLNPRSSIRDQTLLHRIANAVRAHAYEELGHAFTRAQESEEESMRRSAAP